MIVICPVSGTENELDDLETRGRRCKQCGTDLTRLLRIEDLPAACYRSGCGRLERGDTQGALEQLMVAGVMAPESAETQAALGRAWSAAGLHGMAVTHFERAIALAPDRTEFSQARESAVRGRAEDEARRIEAEARVHRPPRPAWSRLLPAFLVGAAAVFVAQGASRWAAPRPDPLSQVRQSLQANPTTRDLGLHVLDSANGVQVEGTVPSELHAELVRAVASGAAGGRVDFAELKAAPPQPPPPPPPRPRPNYRVRPGDSLWRIADRAYGNAALWPHIAEANQGTPGLDGQLPSELQVGDSLVVPAVTIQPWQ